MDALHLDSSPCVLQQAWERRAERTASRVTFHDFVSSDLVLKVVIRKIAANLPQSPEDTVSLVQSFLTFAHELLDIVTSGPGANFFSTEVKDKVKANLTLAECGLKTAVSARHAACAK